VSSWYLSPDLTELMGEIVGVEGGEEFFEFQCYVEFCREGDVYGSYVLLEMGCSGRDI
jgi:hypothetical protein